MEKELREQPGVLAGNDYASQLAGLDESFDMVLLAARGSSDHAALYARYLIEIHLQVPVVLAAPSVITRYKANVKYPKTLAIGISQSGAAPDVAEVIEHLRSNGHPTIGITNTPGSRMAKTADRVLLLNTGPEKAVAATKTYTASLVALYEIVRALKPLPAPTMPDENWLERAYEHAELGLYALLRNHVLFSLGRGYSFATAQECALKLMECALLPCKAYSSADFQHGPRALAGHNAAAVDFDGSASEDNGFEVVTAPKPTCPEECAPIAQAIYAQWLALLAARARGYDPDHPEGLSKVTKTL